MKWGFSILLYLVLSSCGRSKDIKGIVIDKKHQAPYSYIVTNCFYSGKTVMFVPVLCTEPDRWIIYVKDSTVHKIYVNFEGYMNTSIGDSLFRINKKLFIKQNQNSHANQNRD